MVTFRLNGVARTVDVDTDIPLLWVLRDELRLTGTKYGCGVVQCARSAALFTEAGTVLQHPRCLNCHPDGDRPSQGDGYPHQPPVQRGADGLGVSAMRCATCHQAANFDPGRVPGNPKWRLAPVSMAWQRRSLAKICAQIRDPARNGGHTLAEIVDHMAHDQLVGWAWKPGADRQPAPGTQASFGALAKAWVDSGAACPRR